MGAAQWERRLKESNKLLVGSRVREGSRGRSDAWIQCHVSLVNIHEDFDGK
jgi:hypothetical protein